MKGKYLGLANRKKLTVYEVNVNIFYTSVLGSLYSYLQYMELYLIYCCDPRNECVCLWLEALLFMCMYMQNSIGVFFLHWSFMIWTKLEIQQSSRPSSRLNRAEAKMFKAQLSVLFQVILGQESRDGYSSRYQDM